MTAIKSTAQSVFLSCLHQVSVGVSPGAKQQQDVSPRWSQTPDSALVSILTNDYTLMVTDDVTAFHKERQFTLFFPGGYTCSKCGTRFWAPSPAFPCPSLGGPPVTWIPREEPSPGRPEEEVCSEHYLQPQAGGRCPSSRIILSA